MQQITVVKKTGFRVINPLAPLVIRDYRGILFYSTESMLPKVKVFNLPPGKYFIDKGGCTPLPEPVVYKLSKLPTPQRNRKPPHDYEIRFARNPNKCTINWNGGTITFDHSLKEKSLPELFFILYHEFGHARYNTEKYADLFSSNLMLEKGFNPSQIGYAPLGSLSAMQYERKKFIINHIINNQK